MINLGMSSSFERIKQSQEYFSINWRRNEEDRIATDHFSSVLHHQLLSQPSLHMLFSMSSLASFHLINEKNTELTLKLGTSLTGVL